MIKTLKQTTIYFLLMSVMIACKKDKEEVPVDDPVYHAYSNLKIGNLWMYENFSSNHPDSLVSDSTFERVVIVSDTIIRGKRYFIRAIDFLPAGGRRYEYVRDSANYILSIKLNSSTAYNEFCSTPYDTLKSCNGFFDCYTLYMAGYDTVVLPVGTFFQALSYHVTINYSSNSTIYYDSGDEGYYYAEHYGMIMRRSKIISRSQWGDFYNVHEKRLISYSFQD